MTRFVSAALIAICALIGVVPMAAVAYTGHELAGAATVTIDRARAIALKAVPGRITDQELENEHGGSGLRYSFDIRRGGKTYEVGIDAQTGAILENKVEGGRPD